MQKCTLINWRIRNGLQLVGNIDATNSNTAPTWTNHPHALRPVESQQVQTNSATQFINVTDEISPSRRTYNPSTSAAGDTEAIAAKGKEARRPCGRLLAGRQPSFLVNGAAPTVMAQTTVSEVPRSGEPGYISHRNPTYSENTIALPSDRGALDLSGTRRFPGGQAKRHPLGWR
ncbi:MAG: hypothetical protein HRF49_01685 [bacterium]|jgi:hypothetical protein